MCVRKVKYLLLANLARRMKAVDSRISSRMAVFFSVLTKIPGNCGIELVANRMSEAGHQTFWPPPKETPVARAVKFPRLCFEFFLVRRMRRSACRMVLAALT